VKPSLNPLEKQWNFTVFYQILNLALRWIFIALFQCKLIQEPEGRNRKLFKREARVRNLVIYWHYDKIRSKYFLAAREQILPFKGNITCESLKYNQKGATFSRSIYFYKLLYTFQAVPPPITRSTKLYIQRQVLSNQYCCLLLSWISSTTAAGSSTGLTIPDALCTVLCSWWWAEEQPETCRAIYRSK